MDKYSETFNLYWNIQYSAAACVWTHTNVDKLEKSSTVSYKQLHCSIFLFSN